MALRRGILRLRHAELLCRCSIAGFSPVPQGLRAKGSRTRANHPRDARSNEVPRDPEDLFGAYWERFLGSPDLLAWNRTGSFLFAEVKSSGDRVGEDRGSGCPASLTLSYLDETRTPSVREKFLVAGDPRYVRRPWCGTHSRLAWTIANRGQREWCGRARVRGAGGCRRRAPKRASREVARRQAAPTKRHRPNEAKRKG